MSKKTPAKLDDAIESVPKNTTKQSSRYAAVALVGILVVSAGIVYVALRSFAQSDSDRHFEVRGELIHLEVADDDASRQTGLSNRDSIAPNEGMLFVFDGLDSEHCFWMKDTNFALDMIWLDELKRIVTIASDVVPETFPERFCPDTLAKYGIELQSGQAERMGLGIGHTIDFN